MLTQGLLIALAVAAAPTGEAGVSADGPVMSSYTQAYNAADGRPMLVVLNSGSQPAADIHVAALTSDAKLAEALNEYVVAEIDTTTDHGAKVHQLFGNPTLPYVVVINSNKKQVFKESGSMTADELAAALNAPQPQTVTAYRPVSGSGVSAPVDTASVVSSPTVSGPVTSAPVISTPAPVYTAPTMSLPAMSLPTLSAPAPKADCPNCRKYRAYQF